MGFSSKPTILTPPTDGQEQLTLIEASIADLRNMIDLLEAAWLDTEQTRLLLKRQRMVLVEAQSRERSN